MYAVGVLQELLGADADQHVLGLRVVPAAVVDVVRHDEGDVKVAGELYQLGGDRFLILKPVVLQLDVVVVLAEQLLVLAGCLVGTLLVSEEEGLGYLALYAGGQADEPLVVSLQKLPVDAGLVVHPLGKGD